MRGTDSDGTSFIETGRAENISSGGALLRISKPLLSGTRLDVHIRLPMKSQWMKYSAEVIRIENRGPTYCAAVKFDTAKPLFGGP